MNLQGLVSISGKAGLFKLVGQNKSGLILESLDEVKAKIVCSSTNKLATLTDITVYGETDDIPLKEIFQKMDQMQATHPVPNPKDDSKILKKYFSEVVPEHSQEQVYASDIKKIISWYLIISKLPLFTEAEPSAETQEG